MTGKAIVFHNSHINIEGTLIRWEKHTCVISAISHVWIGAPAEGKWRGSKGAEYEGLNVELYSGTVYSFLNSSQDFLLQAYETLCSLLDEADRKGKNTLDFENNSITMAEETEAETEPEEAAEFRPEPAYSVNNPIKQELLVLLEHCKKKGTAGTAVLQLLEDIISCYDGGTGGQNLQEMYRLFVQLSLVNDCNELGLNGLIEEVKSKIYQ